MNLATNKGIRRTKLQGGLTLPNQQPSFFLIIQDWIKRVDRSNADRLRMLLTKRTSNYLSPVQSDRHCPTERHPMTDADTITSNKTDNRHQKFGQRTVQNGYMERIATKPRTNCRKTEIDKGVPKKYTRVQWIVFHTEFSNKNSILLIIFVFIFIDFVLFMFTEPNEFVGTNSHH